MKGSQDPDPLPPGDPVWAILGRAAPPPAAPRLAERVLRRIRTAPQGPGLAGLLLRWALPAAAAAGLAAALLAPQPHEPSNGASPIAFEEAAQLDELVAGSAGWAWSEVAPVLSLSN
ncbi:MAG: hypothetical protein N2322_06005 [Terrimicrobiaceae bacterium]|nr:hypothetical protein [Terrimicrobiaceae bacterium]